MSVLNTQELIAEAIEAFRKNPDVCFTFQIYSKNT